MGWKAILLTMSIGINEVEQKFGKKDCAVDLEELWDGKPYF
jgi:hypothetical protein